VTIRVGGMTVPLETAARWTAAYFDEEANLTSKSPYAYPFYDRYDGGAEQDGLNGGDFLAPVLLNANPKLVGYRTLLKLKAHLVQGLAAIPLDLTLQTAVEADIHRELLACLVQPIDPHGAPGIKLTMLAKVLHRKRPLFFPVYDSYVRACYVGRAKRFPMRNQTGRLDSVFIGEIATYMVADLASQPEPWKQLAAIAPAGVSPLRLLDVVAWNAGRKIAPQVDE
jgi:hypothetical protein